MIFLLFYLIQSLLATQTGRPRTQRHHDFIRELPRVQPQGTGDRRAVMGRRIKGPNRNKYPFLWKKLKEFFLMFLLQAALRLLCAASLCVSLPSSMTSSPLSPYPQE